LGISIKEAAERVGMTKAGVMKAVRAGKLSATKNIQGEWEVEPVELFRVYQPAQTQVVTAPTNSDNSEQNRIYVLEMQVSMLEQRIIEKDDNIRKLFDALTAAQAAVAAQQKITLQIEDKQRQPAWWQRWLSR
jgi:hypothetical protein